MSLGKILITGAGGFIGGHLRVHLDRCGYTILDLRCGKERTPFRLPDERLAVLLADEQPDVVIHCAGGASVSGSFERSAADFSNTVVATEALFDALARVSPRTKTVFVSSAAVYGDAERLPLTEEAPLRPISPYGFHKLMAEIVCRKFHRLHQLPVCILRVFSAYGPGLRKQLLWEIYQRWTKHDEVRLAGSGEESRDFVFIDDLVSAIRVVIERAPFDGEALNVGEGRAVTTRQLASLMLDLLGGAKRLVFTQEQRRGDPARWEADVAKIRALGVLPGVTLDVGVDRYVRWLQAEVAV